MSVSNRTRAYAADEPFAGRTRLPPRARGRDHPNRTIGVNGMKLFPPATTCTICDRALTATGGRRLVAGVTFGIHRRTIEAKLNEFGASWFSARVLRLTDNYRDVIIWLTGKMWTDEAASRAARSFQRGEHPWMCQRCAQWWVCENCGAPLDRTPMADCLSDDG